MCWFFLYSNDDPRKSITVCSFSVFPEDPNNPYFAKYGVFVLQFWCLGHCKEELAAIVIGSCICHGNQTSPNKPQTLVKLILCTNMLVRNIEQKKQKTLK